MNAPFQPERALRPIRGACPFCNEVCVEIWLDPAREDMGHQVRCAMCGASGPWSGEDGAVEAWRAVRPVEID